MIRTTALALLLAASFTAHAQTTTLTMSSWVPPTHYVVKDILQPWMAEVEKSTEGRVKIAVEDKEDGEKVDIRVGSKGVKITATEPAAECDDFD